MVAAAAVGAALGSKLLYLLDDPAAAWEHRGDFAFLLGGKTVVGGLLGGWAAIEIVKRRMGIAARTGDLFAAPILVGIGVGRIGCFLAGLTDKTYGVATELPWGVDFGDGVARHPAQLYESAFALVAAVPVIRATLAPHREGDVFRLTMALYLAWRFAIDFLKPHAFPVSGIQVACLAGLAVIGAGWARQFSVRTSAAA
jgi:phosphatidylglycerol---prolipoprotein diacylglyceryl transferase